jgi:hypothetical protein
VAYTLLKPTSEYEVVAELNMTSEITLRNSPQKYPPGILDRYVQVPENLPPRVSVLARNLIASASNPYDKALAIETYLRTLQYTTASNPIPHDADTVDYFLFESGTGYGDYFASAMVVMLRTQGIPARLVLGFGPGVQDTEKQGFTVRDKDSHSWPEVYFTDIEWVAFEPTPIYSIRTRGTPRSTFGTGGFRVLEGTGEEIGPEPGMLDPVEEQELLRDLGGPLPGGFGFRALPLRHFGTPLGMGGALFGLFLLIGAIIMRVLWLRQYGRLQGPETAYRKMHRLSSFLGVASPLSQTPFEFAYNLSGAIPEAGTEVDLICNTFVRQRYGAITPTPTEELRLVWAWRRVKRALLAQLTHTSGPSGAQG